MANCTLCNQRMTRTTPTCSVAVLHHLGSPYLFRTHEPEPGPRPLDERCGDCGVQVGELHHFGCEWRICPRCDDYADWCGCLWDEFIYAYLALGLLDGERHEELEELVHAAFTRFLRALQPTSGALSHV